MTQQETVRYADVQDIMVVPDGGPEAYHAHWHNAAEFVLALDGPCVYRVQDALYTLRQGDILLIWPRQLHESLSVPKGSACFVQFSDWLLENNLDLVISLRFLTQIHHLPLAEYPDLAGRLGDLMRQLAATYASDHSFRETRCKLLIYQMILLVGDQALLTKKRQLAAESLPIGAWDQIREACAYVGAHYMDDLHQAEVASAVGLSVFYFSRLFSKIMQMSFPQYVTHIRVRAAAGLLGSTSLPVTDCAGRAGFQSITAFNRSFLDVMGIAPRDYRKMYQNIRESP